MIIIKKVVAVSLLAIAMVSGARAEIVSDSKLAGGANGYDINAKTLKVQGADVLTSHQSLSGKQDVLTTGDGGNLQAGSNVQISKDANNVITISATDTVYTLPNATASTLGGVKDGNYVTITDGVLSADVATTSAKGVVQVGTNIGVNNGVISVADASPSVKGVTKMVYGPTDAASADDSAENVLNKIVSTDSDELTAAMSAMGIASSEAALDGVYPSLGAVSHLMGELQTDLSSNVADKQDMLESGENVTISGSGNVVTDVSATGGSVTITKGTTLGSLATKSAVDSSDITDGTIVNADISSSAAIAQSKISGLTDALTNAQNKIPSGSENSTTLASFWVE